MWFIHIAVNYKIMILIELCHLYSKGLDLKYSLVVISNNQYSAGDKHLLNMLANDFYELFKCIKFMKYIAIMSKIVVL